MWRILAFLLSANAFAISSNRVAVYPDGPFEVSLAPGTSVAVNVPGGLATATNQVAGNNSLASIDAKTGTRTWTLSMNTDSVASTQLGSWTVTTVGNKSGTATLTQVPLSTSSGVMLSSNPSRNGLIVHNDSSSSCYLSFAATSSLSAYTLKIPSQAEYFMIAPIYTGIISDICESAIGELRVTEL